MPVRFERVLAGERIIEKFVDGVGVEAIVVAGELAKLLARRTRMGGD
ncbi:hypothetical protein [Halorubrum sp. Atlit-26R]|nr:hypothetical protein [Halorubrum sp. Atlit-26R]